MSVLWFLAGHLARPGKRPAPPRRTIAQTRATPAIAGGRLFVRTSTRVLCLEGNAKRPVGDKPAAHLDRLGDPLPQGALLRLGSDRLSHQGSVYCTAFSPDGKVLASGGGYYDGTVRLWEPTTGKELLRFGRGTPVRDLVWSADGKYVSIGSIEPQFYAILLDKLELAGADLPAQMDRASWPGLKERFTALFRTKTREEWCRIMEGTDICFAPVLSMSQARAHPHNVARGTFVDVGGAPQPAPAPRFSRTPAAVPSPPVAAGAHTDTALAGWGFTPDDVVALKSAGAIA